MGRRRKHTVTRWIEDMVDDTKDYVEEDARDAISDFVDSDDDDDHDHERSARSDRIASELGVLSAALEELTAKVNVLADLQAGLARNGGGTQAVPMPSAPSAGPSASKA
jgi:hypothetical protein